MNERLKEQEHELGLKAREHGYKIINAVKAHLREIQEQTWFNEDMLESCTFEISPEGQVFIACESGDKCQIYLVNNLNKENIEDHISPHDEWFWVSELDLWLLFVAL